MKFNTFIILLFVSINISFAQIFVVEAFPNLTFSRPVDLQHAPDGTDRIFVVSQSGDIHIFSTADSTISETILFFSLQDSVRCCGEQGLLGLTFHPDYQYNGYLYVSYNPSDSPNRSVIARYEVSSNPDSADQSKKTIILEVDQPYTNHNGGQIGFGADGYLYFGLGDGGSGGDPEGNAQNLRTLLGTILRIDVDNTSEYGNYAIPSDNPFVGNDSSYREEIYAYGLRNPWRWSFDLITGWLWVGDVGQNKWEEIDIVEKGLNYGWDVMEGFHCHEPSSGCNENGLTYPLVDYPHGASYSVTGGHVYRGSKVPDLYGKYVYGDYGSGIIWTIEYDGVNQPDNELLTDTELSISAFGIDKDYELYICDLDGKIYKFHQPGVINTKILQSPILIAPANNTNDADTTTINFKWKAVEDAENYMLEISSDIAFNADYSYTETTDTIASVVFNGEAGKTYFWHVRAASTEDTSHWSTIWKFTTLIAEMDSLQAPVLLSPANNSDNIPADTVNFVWKDVQNTENYILEVSSDNGFIADYFNVLTPDTHATVIINAGEGVDFFWHVRAANIQDSSDWSETWKFTTEQTTAFDDNKLKPNSFNLDQNHPNPFNPTTKIGYNIGAIQESPEHVLLQIFDINGKEIQILVNGEQNAGSYSVVFDASNLPSGIYFYRIETSSGFSQCRKMILLK